MSKLDDFVRFSVVDRPPPKGWRRSEIRRDDQTGAEWAVDYDPDKVRCVLIANVGLASNDIESLRSMGWEHGTATVPGTDRIVGLLCAPAVVAQRPRTALTQAGHRRSL